MVDEDIVNQLILWWYHGQKEEQRMSCGLYDVFHDASEVILATSVLNYIELLTPYGGIYMLINIYRRN